MDSPILTILMINIVMGFIVAAIFSSKGRPAIGGFFLGLLLGLIGLVIALLVSPDTEKIEERKLKNSKLDEPILPTELSPATQDIEEAVQPSIETAHSSSAQLIE